MIKSKRPKKNKTEKNPGVKELTSKKEVHQIKRRKGKNNVKFWGKVRKEKRKVVQFLCFKNTGVIHSFVC